MKRRPIAIALAILLPIVLIAGFGWREAQCDPVVRRATVGLPNWPDGARPISLLLISDTHVSWPSMTPARLQRIVAELNALHPDAILIAGDMVSEQLLGVKTDTRESIAPLGKLRAPLGVYAVLGNHDHRRGVAPIRRALRRTPIRLLENEAVRVGPVTLGGMDDPVTDHADIEGTVWRMAEMGGPQIVLAHGTSPFDWLPKGVTLMLAGHTHCGQIRPVRHEPCGIVRKAGRTMIVGAGISTSILPLRIGAPPDVWLITVGSPGVSRPPSD